MWHGCASFVISSFELLIGYHCPVQNSVEYQRRPMPYFGTALNHLSTRGMQDASIAIGSADISPLIIIKIKQNEYRVRLKTYHDENCNFS